MQDFQSVAAAARVLIVEDDLEISALIASYLNQHGLLTSIAADGRQMVSKLRQEAVDLIVLDLNFPHDDGLSLCVDLRKSSEIPIIMVTARCEEIDRIIGLEMGADDYLPKPFNPRELLARIRAILRRRSDSFRKAAKRSLQFSGWKVDRFVRRVHNPHGVNVMLTSAEFDLLLAFCDHPHRVLSREQLLDFTRGRETGAFERSIDILVSRLRQKMERNPHDPDMIKTVRCGGYLFTPDIEAA